MPSPQTRFSFNNPNPGAKCIAPRRGASPKAVQAGHSRPDQNDWSQTLPYASLPGGFFVEALQRFFDGDNRLVVAIASFH